MNICINPFSINGFLTIMFTIGLLAFLYKLCNIYNKKYTLDSNSYMYDSDSESETEFCNNDDFSDDEHYD